MIIVSLSQCNFPTSFAVLLYLHVLTREVVSPKRPDLVLSADIPDVEARVLVRDGLDVESDGRDGVDFAGGARGELEGVEDGFKEVRLLASALLAGLACSSQWHGESQAVAGLLVHWTDKPPIMVLGEETTYWSFRRRRDQASAGAFLCCRRSWPLSGRWRRPLRFVFAVRDAMRLLCLSGGDRMRWAQLWLMPPYSFVAELAASTVRCPVRQWLYCVATAMRETWVCWLRGDAFGRVDVGRD